MGLVGTVGWRKDDEEVKTSECEMGEGREGKDGQGKKMGSERE